MRRMDKYEKLAFELDQAIYGDNVEVIELSISKVDEALNVARKQDLPTLWYFRANCFGALRRIRSSSHEYAFGWAQPDLDQEILSLRRVVQIFPTSVNSTILGVVKFGQIWDWPSIL